MPAIMNQGDLALTLDITTNTIRDWTRKGMPVKEPGKRGQAAQYNVAEVIRWRESQIRAAALGDTAAMDHDESKRRKLAAEAALSEIELSKARDEVVDIDLVVKEFSTSLSMIRARLLQVGAKVAPHVELAPDASSVKEIIDDALYEALDDISEGALKFVLPAEEDVEDEEQRSLGEGDASAPKTDFERMG